MTRRLNLRLLLLSLASLVLVGLAVHLLHSFQMQGNAAVLLRQALEQQDPKKAVTFFSHYLICRPDDLEARAQYALTLEKAGVPAGQLRNVLEQVLRRAPQQHQVRYRLVHCLIRLHRWREASDEIGRLLPSWPNQAELEHIRGWCQEASGAYPAAVASFGRAIQQDPHKLESYVLLAEVLENRLDQAEDAQKTMDDLVQANPTSFRAYLLRARFRQKHQELEAAAQDLQQALTLAPKEAEALLATTELAEARGQLKVARTCVERGLQLHPQNVLLYKAEAALATPNLPRALELARQAVAADSRDYRDLLWLARILHLARQDDQAEEALRRALQLAGHTPDTWIALVAQLAWTGKRSQAEALLEEARQKLPSDRAPLAVARGQELLGQLDLAEATYRQALKARPDDFILLMNVADFCRRSEQPAQAVPFLRRLLEPATGAPAEFVFRARRLLALVLGSDGDPHHYQEALALLDRNVQGRGEEPADLRARALVLGSQPGQQVQALAIFEKSLQRPLSPSLPGGRGGEGAPAPEEEFGLALLCEAAGDHLRAREILQGLLVTQPENPQLLARLGQLLVQQGELAQAQEYLQRLQKLEPATPRSRALQKALDQARAAAK